MGLKRIALPCTEQSKCWISSPKHHVRLGTNSKGKITSKRISIQQKTPELRRKQQKSKEDTTTDDDSAIHYTSSSSSGFRSGRGGNPFEEWCMIPITENGNNKNNGERLLFVLQSIKSGEYLSSTIDGQVILVKTTPSINEQWQLVAVPPPTQQKSRQDGTHNDTKTVYNDTSTLLSSSYLVWIVSAAHQTKLVFDADEQGIRTTAVMNSKGEYCDDDDNNNNSTNDDDDHHLLETPDDRSGGYSSVDGGCGRSWSSTDMTWLIEWNSGELIFMSLPFLDKRVQCNMNGKLSFHRNWKGWEIWRFIEADLDGNVYITSRTHDDYFLSSNANGAVFTTSTAASSSSYPQFHGLYEKWKIIKNEGNEGQSMAKSNERSTVNGVTIVSVAHQRILSCSNDGVGLQTTIPPSQLEDGTVRSQISSEGSVWQFESANRGLFHICPSSPYNITDDDKKDKRNKNKLYLACRPPSKTAEAIFTTHVPFGSPMTEWTIQETGYASVMIRSKRDGTFLGVDEFGNITATRGWAPTGRSNELHDNYEPTEYETWRMESHQPLPDGNRHPASISNTGYVNFLSEKGHFVLACNAEGKLYTTALKEENHSEANCDASWYLEPVLPHSISKPQLVSLAVAGTATVALATVLPFAVSGMMSSWGATAATGTACTAEGVAATTAAAGNSAILGMMPGLEVTVTATAAGLGSFGTVMALGSGAVLGGTLSAATLLRNSVLESENGINVATDEDYNHDDHHNVGLDDSSRLQSTAGSCQQRPFCNWSQW